MDEMKKMIAECDEHSASKCFECVNNIKARAKDYEQLENKIRELRDLWIQMNSRSSLHIGIDSEYVMAFGMEDNEKIYEFNEFTEGENDGY